MIRILALCLFWLPGAALAQSFPALYDVTGVASDDVLNVREAPNANAQIIATLGPKATQVEVVRADTSGHWGLVNVNEQAGWASLRYLAVRPAGDYLLTRHLQCSGTEPFWNLTITQGQSAHLQGMALSDVNVPVGLLQIAYGRSDRYSLRGQSNAMRLSVIIRREDCSDGMSERQFGFDTDILVEGNNDPYHISGCCSLVGN